MLANTSEKSSWLFAYNFVAQFINFCYCSEGSNKDNVLHNNNIPTQKVFFYASYSQVHEIVSIVL